MPVSGAEPEMLFHRFAFDDFVRVVMFEGERVFGVRPFVSDLGDVEKGGSHNGMLRWGWFGINEGLLKSRRQMNAQASLEL